MKTKSSNRTEEYLTWAKAKLEQARSVGRPTTLAMGGASLLLTSYGTLEAEVIRGSELGFTPLELVSTGQDVFLNMSNPAAGLFFGGNTVVPHFNMNNAGGGFLYNLAFAQNPAGVVSDGVGTLVYGRAIRFGYNAVIDNNMLNGRGYFNYQAFFADWNGKGAWAPVAENSSVVGFVGIVFDSGEPGWIKLEVFHPTGAVNHGFGDDYGFRILDWAYETSTAPGSSITTPSPVAVPEPASAAALAAGAAAIAAVHSRRRQRLAAQAAN
jgi:hypothetical protein